MQYTYTILAAWLNCDRSMSDRFAVSLVAESKKTAHRKAACAVLARYPDVADLESPDTLWGSTAEILAMFYGDRTEDLVDYVAYDIIYA
ncbi:hypothetical protein [Streptomyces sp. NPDC047999]|uniref:hypothetical protein n=1 Tax=Streptomyces sp. NPDC047999 TaxID=3365497 RepID=UPI003721C77D